MTDDAYLLDDLSALTAGYLAEVAGLSYADLGDRQLGPKASLAYGGAGLVYVLCRLSHLLPEPSVAASRLVEELAHAPIDDYWAPQFGERPDLSMSFLDGPLGRHWVANFCARATGDARLASAERERFLKGCMGFESQKSELLFGAAGALGGLVSLYEQAHDEATGEVAHRVADRILSRAGASSDDWTKGRWGFGHGTAGILHALLRYENVLRGGVSAPLRKILDEFTGRVVREHLGAERTAALSVLKDARWCNGVAGLILLWVKAFEATRDERYRELAKRDAGSVPERADGASGSLCCGLGGCAYALLALDRIDPEGPWYERATRCAYGSAHALLADSGDWPNGLYHGYAGLSCLVNDLKRERGERVGFPLIEGG